jgi:hypothetical protein
MAAKAHGESGATRRQTDHTFGIMWLGRAPKDARRPLVDTLPTVAGHSSTSPPQTSTNQSTGPDRAAPPETALMPARPTCCGHPTAPTTTSCVLGLTGASSRRIVNRSLARAETPHLDGPEIRRSGPIRGLDAQPGPASAGTRFRYRRSYDERRWNTALKSHRPGQGHGTKPRHGTKPHGRYPSAEHAGTSRSPGPPIGAHEWLEPLVNLSPSRAAARTPRKGT